MALTSPPSLIPCGASSDVNLEASSFNLWCSSNAFSNGAAIALRFKRDTLRMRSSFPSVERYQLTKYGIKHKYSNLCLPVDFRGQLAPRNYIRFPAQQHMGHTRAQEPVVRRTLQAHRSI